MAVQIDVSYQGELHCEAVHGPSGQRLVTDAPTDNGGKGEAFSPTDLVATGLGTCLSTIMAQAAARKGIDLAGTRVKVIKEMTPTGVRRIAALRATVTLPPGRVPREADRKLLEAAARACPVKESLHPDVVLDLVFDYPA